MTSSLPQLLTDHDLPYAELQAAVLDGDVFRVDRAFCSVAEFDVPWRRASALSQLVSGGGGVVVAERSAAWVWGALASAPILHSVFRAGGGKHLDELAGVRVRAVGVDPDDIVDFGAVRVTSPTRTVVDLCRGDGYSDEVAAMVSRLIAEHRVERSGCNAVLDRARSLPHRRRACARLEGLGLVG